MSGAAPLRRSAGPSPGRASARRSRPEVGSAGAGAAGACGGTSRGVRGDGRVSDAGDDMAPVPSLEDTSGAGVVPRLSAGPGALGPVDAVLLASDACRGPAVRDRTVPGAGAAR